MKKAYVKPSMESEAFVPNAYCSQCGDSGTNYYFECNAGEPYRYKEHGIFGSYWVTDEYPYRVVADNGRRWPSYGPCDETHIANSEDEFLTGYIDNVHTPENENIRVIIWTEWGTDVHCTTNLNKESWVTAKS